jgi:hypothetical protein
MAIVTTPADVVDGSVLAVSAEPPAGTSSRQIRPRPSFGAWGQEEKQKDCKTDNVSIQQLQNMTFLQDSGSIPGGFDYRRFAFVYHPTTPRDQWQGFYQLYE